MGMKKSTTRNVLDGEGGDFGWGWGRVPDAMGREPDAFGWGMGEVKSTRLDIVTKPLRSIVPTISSATTDIAAARVS